LHREDILGGDRRGDPIASDHEGTRVHRAGGRAIPSGVHIVANFAGLRPGAAHELITELAELLAAVRRAAVKE